ncbi:MAG: LPS-assembly protein LptD [Saezia sp.]
MLLSGVLLDSVAKAVQNARGQARPLVVDTNDEKNAASHKQALKGTVVSNKARHQGVYSAAQKTPTGLDRNNILGASAYENPEALPIYISGDHLEGNIEATVKMIGRSQLIRGTTVLQSDELAYNRKTEIATANGQVRIHQDGNLLQGIQAQVHLPTMQGSFNEATYQIYETSAHGTSAQVDLKGEQYYSLKDATYTLCQVEKNGRYDWVLQADSIDLDLEKDEGVARNVVMRFMNAPILATPWMSFPLSDKRRSGLLVPYFDLSEKNGFTYYQPYYWNIAPNYDATITPFLMTERGIGLETEFRYLQPTFSGEFKGLYLPNDRLRRSGGETNVAQLDSDGLSHLNTGQIHYNLKEREDRWGYGYEHRQLLSEQLSWLGRAQLDLSLNRVSDDHYWQDFSKGVGSFSSRLLNNEGTITAYNNGLSSLLRIQRWQTLQAEDSYIIPPYDRDQLRLNYNSERWHGFDLSAMADMTRFDSKDITRATTNASRGILELAASYPYKTAGFFFVPKAKLTSRYYDFKEGIAYAENGTPHVKQSLSATLPTLSLDSGLIFERDARLFSRDYIQTLEPRVMYVYTPYKDQRLIPLYDTSEYDYNSATVFLDNPYSGYDRIADTNMLILGVGTSWLMPETGAQVLSFNIAQRLRFEDQEVTLDNEPITSRYSDVLFNVSTSLVRDWQFDALVQYDTDKNNSRRSLLMARWKPGSYRVMNFGYRMQRHASEQLDFSWQWPLGAPWAGAGLPERNKNGARWYSVGRVNYSLRDRKLVDSVLGLEYQSCCWIARAMFERLSTGRAEATTRLFFQLEFSGLSRVGVNPLQRLRDNITHYETIQNERIIRPNDFYLYE